MSLPIPELLLSACEEAMQDAPGGISRRGSHRLTTVAQCPRRWYMRFERKLIPKKRVVYFVLGTLVHVCLAYWWARRLPERPRWADNPLKAELERLAVGFPELVPLALDILYAYAMAHPDATEVWTPVAIEHEYEASVREIREALRPGSAPLPQDAEVVTSRIDLMVESGGYLWAVDYKTTKGDRGRLTPVTSMSEHGLSFQFKLQYAILRARFGTRFRGIIVQRILKQPPFAFDRTVVPITPVSLFDTPIAVARLAEMEAQVQQLAADAESRGEDMEVWLPSGNWWSCYSGGRACDHAEACHASVDERRIIMVRDYNSR